MNLSVAKLIDSVSFGSPQSYKNMTVIPLFHNNGDKLIYRTLSESIKAKEVEITEVSESGHVPELKVINHSDNLVLIIDGEQFIGAKQNRVINATVLLEKKTTTIINVACVEQGRWNYSKNKHFADSDNLMNYEIRAKRMASVNMSLKVSNKFRADQSEVWEDVAAFSRKAKVVSNTMAMDDVYDKNEKEFGDYQKEFKTVENQKGMIIIINGEIAGIEYLSNAESFSNVAEKLIKSYSSTAHFDNKEYKEVDYVNQSKEFLNYIRYGYENMYKSVGLGEDYRYESKEGFASALVHESEVVHFVGVRLPNEKEFSKTQRIII